MGSVITARACSVQFSSVQFSLRRRRDRHSAGRRDGATAAGGRGGAGLGPLPLLCVALNGGGGRESLGPCLLREATLLLLFYLRVDNPGN